MINVIISESRHCVVAVVVVRLKPEIDTFLLSDLFCSSNEVFWEKLALFVEVVASTLK